MLEENQDFNYFRDLFRNSSVQVWMHHSLITSGEQKYLKDFQIIILFSPTQFVFSNVN